MLMLIMQTGKKNPEVYTVKKMIVDNTIHLSLELAAGGGTAISIIPK